MPTDNRTPTAPTSRTDETLPGVSLSPTDLFDQQATVPFVGLTDQSPSGYPEDIPATGLKFASDTDTAPTFKEMIQQLPQAQKSKLWSENRYVSRTDTGEISVDTDAIESLTGLDIDALEHETGQSLSELADTSRETRLDAVEDHVDIVDPRRQALAALGFDVPYRWQVATDSYNPGDIQELYRRQIVAAQKRGFDHAWGWVDFNNWGGHVRVTTLYPDLRFEIDGADGIDYHKVRQQFSLVSTPDDVSLEESMSVDDTDETTVVYYGAKVSHDFRGAQTIRAQPVMYVPSRDALIELQRPTFSRRHQGDFMNANHEEDNGRTSPTEWHGEILDKLEEMSGEVAAETVRARLIQLDFSKLPFGIDEFYGYLGVSSQTLAETAADHARRFADPPTNPSLWNLQLSLKTALVEAFNGSRAGQSYADYAAVAGEMLRDPAKQLQAAFAQYHYEAQENIGVDVNQDQITSDPTDATSLNGVTESDISAVGATEADRQIQEQLAQFVGDD